jgi:hypothetical protein
MNKAELDRLIGQAATAALAPAPEAQTPDEQAVPVPFVLRRCAE